MRYWHYLNKLNQEMKKTLAEMKRDILAEKIEVLRDYIISYESDSFSASRTDITQKEVDMIIEQLLAQIEFSINGVMLDEMLKDVRTSDD